MKVLFFTQVGNGGGAEKMTANIASFLNREKNNIKFYAFRRYFKKGLCPVPEGIPIIQFRMIYKWILTVPRLVFLLYKERPDFVFASLQYINWRLIIASKVVGGIKIIVRNENTLALSSMLDKFFMKKVYRYADVIIAQQEEMKEEIVNELQVNPNKVHVLYNPINEDLINSMSKEKSPYLYPEKQIKFVNVSRVSYLKGQDILLKAFAQVHKKIDNSHLYIIGKYEENGFYKELLNLINSEKLNGFVHFVGFDDNPYKWVKNANCFILTSRVEGLPNALIEAMYLRVPVVAATCIPIIERMIDDGINGFCVPVDDVKKTAEAMEHALWLKDVKPSWRPNNKEDYVKLFN